MAKLERVDGHVAIGCMTRQRAVETSADVAASCPLLVEAVRHIGHVQIRNRGTVGGSLAHADPAAELPAVAVALGAEMVVRSPAGERVIPAMEFFEGPFTTALQPTELLTEVRFPVTGGMRTAFLELARRTGDFALAGVAAKVRFEPDSTRAAVVGLAAFGVGSTAIRLSGAEAALLGSEVTEEAITAAAAAASAEVSPFTDVHADEDYRRHLVGVLLSRALRRTLRGPDD
jgi:carbon-monoxide dehydrogenase medium subunit